MKIWQIKCDREHRNRTDREKGTDRKTEKPVTEAPLTIPVEEQVQANTKHFPVSLHCNTVQYSTIAGNLLQYRDVHCSMGQYRTTHYIIVT